MKQDRVYETVAMANHDRTKMKQLKKKHYSNKKNGLTEDSMAKKESLITLRF